MACACALLYAPEEEAFLFVGVLVYVKTVFQEDGPFGYAMCSLCTGACISHSRFLSFCLCNDVLVPGLARRRR